MEKTIEELKKEIEELEAAFNGVLHDASVTDTEIRELLSQIYPELEQPDEKVPTLEYGVEKLVNDYLALKRNVDEIKENLNSLETFVDDEVFYVSQDSVLTAVKEIL